MYIILHLHFTRRHFVDVVLHAALPPPAPKFTSLPEDVEIRENQPAEFVCHVWPHDSKVRWFVEDDEVSETSGERFQLLEDDDKRTLTIRPAKKCDEGVVKVVVGDDEEAVANLTVEGENQGVRRRCHDDVSSMLLSNSSDEFRFSTHASMYDSLTSSYDVSDWLGHHLWQLLVSLAQSVVDFETRAYVLNLLCLLLTMCVLVLYNV